MDDHRTKTAVSWYASHVHTRSFNLCAWSSIIYLMWSTWLLLLSLEHCWEIMIRKIYSRSTKGEQLNRRGSSFYFLKNSFCSDYAYTLELSSFYTVFESKKNYLIEILRSLMTASYMFVCKRIFCCSFYEIFQNYS